MANRWVSLNEVSAHLGVSKETVYRWLDKSRIPAHKIGRQWKFDLVEIDEWVISGKAANDTTISKQDYFKNKGKVIGT